MRVQDILDSIEAARSEAGNSLVTVRRGRRVDGPMLNCTAGEAV